MTTIDYNEIVSGFVSFLRSKTALTSLLAERDIGGTASGANNITVGVHPGNKLQPGVNIRYTGPHPADRTMHENPMDFVYMRFFVLVHGEADALGAIMGALDSVIESGNLGGATEIPDTANWSMKDLETSVDWTAVAPEEVRQSGSGQHTEGREKVYALFAALRR